MTTSLSPESQQPNTPQILENDLIRSNILSYLRLPDFHTVSHLNQYLHATLPSSRHDILAALKNELKATNYKQVETDLGIACDALFSEFSEGKFDEFDLEREDLADLVDSDNAPHTVTYLDVLLIEKLQSLSDIIMLVHRMDRLRRSKVGSNKNKSRLRFPLRQTPPFAPLTHRYNRKAQELCNWAEQDLLDACCCQWIHCKNVPMIKTQSKTVSKDSVFMTDILVLQYYNNLEGTPQQLASYQSVGWRRALVFFLREPIVLDLFLVEDQIRSFFDYGAEIVDIGLGQYQDTDVMVDVLLSSIPNMLWGQLDLEEGVHGE